MRTELLVNSSALSSELSSWFVSFNKVAQDGRPETPLRRTKMAEARVPIGMTQRRRIKMAGARVPTGLTPLRCPKMAEARLPTRLTPLRHPKMAGARLKTINRVQKQLISDQNNTSELAPQRAWTKNNQSCPKTAIFRPKQYHRDGTPTGPD